MSQKTMVSWRRSAVDFVALVAAGPAAGASAGPDAVRLARRLAPHSEQKRSSWSTACPQFGQARVRALPHLLQNLLPSTTSALQPGHCKVRHLLTFFQYWRIFQLEGRFCRLSYRLSRIWTWRRWFPAVRILPVLQRGCVNRPAACQRARTPARFSCHLTQSIMRLLPPGTVRHVSPPAHSLARAARAMLAPPLVHDTSRRLLEFPPAPGLLMTARPDAP